MNTESNVGIGAQSLIRIIYVCITFVEYVLYITELNSLYTTILVIFIRHYAMKVF